MHIFVVPHIAHKLPWAAASSPGDENDIVYVRVADPPSSIYLTLLKSKKGNK